MRRPLVSIAAFLAGAGLTALVAPADAAPLQSPKPEPDEFVVSDYGRPKEFAKGKPARHWLWYENGTWHYRTTSAAGDKHHFTGRIDLVGGGLAADPVGLKGETKGQNADRYVYKDNALTLSFTPAGGVDGFDFKVDDRVTHLKLDLLVDGKRQPNLVTIGRSGDHPKEGAFKLTAHPPEPKPEPQGKKKKKK